MKSSHSEGAGLGIMDSVKGLFMADSTETPHPHQAAAAPSVPPTHTTHADHSAHAMAGAHHTAEASAHPEHHPEHGAHTAHPATEHNALAAPADHTNHQPLAAAAHHATDASPHPAHAEHPAHAVHPVAAESVVKHPAHAANDGLNHHTTAAHPPAANDDHMHTSPHLAIVGGGISGLVAASEALKHGVKNIHVYESADRLGGRILSGLIDNTIVNRGAEFVDSDNTHVIALCQELGIPLVENKGMELELFQRPDGSLMDSEKFYASYKPYAEQIMRDREMIAANPTSARAQHVKSLTLDAYLNELKGSMPSTSFGWWQSLKDSVMFRGNESHTALRIAANIYAAEAGRLPHEISAAQFIAETSPDTATFLTSDCKLRVEGGTEQIINKLRERLAEHGVTFHTNHALTEISKDAEGKTTLHFKGASPVHAEKTILATAAYALKDIKGLEHMGFDAAELELLKNTQYTNSVKCTVALQPGAKAPDAAFYGNGYQAWMPVPGQVTFLANAEGLGTTISPKDLLTGVMSSYAKSCGSSLEKMFDISRICFSNPGKSACYASPKPEQLAALEGVHSQVKRLAQHGIGIAGTYIPHNGAFGFMECGVVSAKNAVEMMGGKEHAHGHEQQKQWAQHVVQQRAEAANDEHAQGVANSR